MYVYCSCIIRTEEKELIEMLCFNLINYEFALACCNVRLFMALHDYTVLGLEKLVYIGYLNSTSKET